MCRVCAHKEQIQSEGREKKSSGNRQTDRIDDVSLFLTPSRHTIYEYSTLLCSRTLSARTPATGGVYSFPLTSRLAIRHAAKDTAHDAISFDSTSVRPTKNANISRVRLPARNRRPGLAPRGPSTTNGQDVDARGTVEPGLNPRSLPFFIPTRPGFKTPRSCPHSFCAPG